MAFKGENEKDADRERQTEKDREKESQRQTERERRGGELKVLAEFTATNVIFLPVGWLVSLSGLHCCLSGCLSFIHTPFYIRPVPVSLC